MIFLQQLSRSIIVICVAFTCSTLCYLSFSSIQVFPELTNQMILTIFLLVVILMTFMHVMTFLKIDNIFIVYLSELGIMYIVILGAAYLFNLFPLTVNHIVLTFIASLLSYIAVVIIMFINETLQARYINKKIQERNRTSNLS